jgi:ATP synthase protein I
MPHHLDSGPADSGDLSHDSGTSSAHRSPVKPAPTLSRVIVDGRAAINGKRFYRTLSASSVGLELGLSVVFGVLFGRWLDGKLGTAPWLMIAFLALGLVAGFRSMLRAVHRLDREAEAEKRHG